MHSHGREMRLGHTLTVVPWSRQAPLGASSCRARQVRAAEICRGRPKGVAEDNTLCLLEDCYGLKQYDAEQRIVQGS